MSVLSNRKADHLELCASDAVAYRATGTLLDCVRLPHDSLPDLDLDALDTRCSLLGKTLRAPLIIAGMTGGHPDARAINRDLASVAEERGYGFGLGSQRAMERQPELAATYRVRDVAPGALVLGNIGVIQARDLPTERVAAVLDDVGADALCLHMSPAMELIQAHGDRDFRGGLDTFARLVSELRVPVVAKETGNGIGQACARRLSDAGVLYADASGAGGTSWVGVETLRAEPDRQALGEALWDWGTPTAASVHYQAWAREGRQGALDFMTRVESEFRAVLLLTGCGTLNDLHALTPMVVGELRDYVHAEPQARASRTRSLAREVRA